MNNIIKVTNYEIFINKYLNDIDKNNLGKHFTTDKENTRSDDFLEKISVIDFDGNYDVEDYLQSKLDCSGIDFDSEYSQFFAYAKTEERAIKFADDVQSWFDNLKKLIN